MKRKAASQLLMRFCGGNAFIFSSGNRRVDVGPVARPKGARNFKPHVMYLKLREGTARKHPRYRMPPREEDGSWPLRGFTIEPRPEGRSPGRSSLKTSPRRQPPTPCGAGTKKAGPVDNMFFVADLQELHPEARLKKRWWTLLDNQIVLKTGRLGVRRIRNCYTFARGDFEERPPQSLADGRAGTFAGVFWSMGVRRSLDIIFSDRQTGKRYGLQLAPTAEGMLVLDVAVDEPYGETPGPDDEVLEFQQFYELLRGVSKDKRFRLLFRHSQPSTLCPGSECAGARFRGVATRRMARRRRRQKR